ncbi:hypothetical protein MMC25_004767 [Agyrium rufum]|nr:hypothetical protein [Agyrium rufum]
MLTTLRLPLLAPFLALASAQTFPDLSTSLIQVLLAQYNDTLPDLYKINPATTQIIESLALPVQVQIERNSYVYRSGAQLMLDGKQWTASGANVYWLGLDENVIPPAGQPFYAKFNASYPTHGRITEVMNTLQTMGARLIRSQTLGVSVGNPLSVWPALNQVNQAAFDTIDYSVFQARQHGIRIMAPLTDNYDYYHGGKFDFLRFGGQNVSSANTSVNPPQVQQFYTNATIVGYFKDYIKDLLTHVNPYTGLTYAEDPTIMGYETGNELGGPLFGDMDVPVEWTTEIAQYIKSLAPRKLVIDGTYGVNKTHLAIPELDIFSDHYYPPNNTKLQDDIALVATVNKPYLVGEYDWTANNPSASSLQSFYGLIESRQTMKNPVVIGDLFWSLFMHDVPNCNIFVNHTDGYELQYGNPLNSAQNNTQISLIRQHFFRMMGQTVSSYLPAVACPGNTAEYTYL